MQILVQIESTHSSQSLLRSCRRECHIHVSTRFSRLPCRRGFGTIRIRNDKEWLPRAGVKSMSGDKDFLTDV